MESKKVKEDLRANKGIWSTEDNSKYLQEISDESVSEKPTSSEFDIVALPEIDGAMIEDLGDTHIEFADDFAIESTLEIDGAMIEDLGDTHVEFADDFGFVDLEDEYDMENTEFDFDD